MKGRRGQVALYLVLVLVAICLLAVMNVGTFLSVSARNRTMNAGDAAALAVARHQQALLNEIGGANVEHLRAVLDRSLAPELSADEREQRLEAAKTACEDLMRFQRERCFFGPLEGIAIGNDWAKRNGISESDEESVELLRQHAIDIRVSYAASPELYPAPWEGAWEEYAQRLEVQLANGLFASPDNIEFMDNAGGHILLNPQFYNAVAGRNWCWFHFNAPGLPESYSSYRDWQPLPSADDETRRRRSCNSEIYSLHLVRKQGPALLLFGQQMLMDLTSCTEEDIRDSVLVNDPEQVWYCYDTSESGLWRTWWEIDPDGEWQFPVVGKVKREYDVRGCAAVCRVTQSFADVVSDGERRIRWTAAAKPFGTVETEDGETDVVTARGGLVLPSFNDGVRLVPLDTVGGRDTERPNLDMVVHVKSHLPDYLRRGVAGLPSGCYYCNQLRQWEQARVHEEARAWLRANAGSCRRSTSGGMGRGGTPHGH